MKIRNVKADDYLCLSQIVTQWRSEHSIFELVPRLFFEHFQSTSFIVETQKEAIGVCIGFISQTDEKQAYIHFIAVHPNYREQGVGRMLYKHFMQNALNRGCEQISCITTPINKRSRAFHKSLGFEEQLHENYNGMGEHRIILTKKLSEYFVNQ